MYENLYYSQALEPEKRHAEQVILELFDYWTQKPSALPSSYREKATTEPLIRVVCDYIAGMTDTYILEQHQKYCG